MNATVADGIESGGKLYLPNPKARAQFGKNARNVAFLTVGLIDAETDEKITLEWLGDDVPQEMVRVAVAHDSGKNLDAATISIKLENAHVFQTGARTGKKRHDPRPNHDTDKTGSPYKRGPRRHHNRLSVQDVRVRDRRLKDALK